MSVCSQSRGPGWVSLGFSLLGLSLDPRDLQAVDDDASEVRRQIEAHWASFDSMECRSVERVETSGAAKSSVNTIDFSWKIDGRSAWSQTVERDDRTICAEIRGDGAQRTYVQYFDSAPKAINTIRIAPSRTKPGHYDDLMFIALWAFLPGGQTPASILAEGGTLKNLGTSSHPRWTITAQLAWSSIECVLDEAHQFLPQEMTVRTSSRNEVIRVDRFEQANGFWYPAKGSGVITPTNATLGQASVAFQLDQVRINESIPNAKFVWTSFPAGAEVDNQIQRTRKAIGGKLARIKLTRAHLLRKQPAPTNPPLQVADDPGAGTRRWVTGILFGIAILAGGIGLALRRRDGSLNPQP